MDVAIGAKVTWVMMDLLTKSGEGKVVGRRTYPLTGVGCVTRICTDLATFAWGPEGLTLVDAVERFSLDKVECFIGLPLTR